MINKGYLLAVSGLILGLLIGVGIIVLERKVANLLVELLNEESFSACGGIVEVDQVNVSLLRLRAVAVRPRLEVNGQVALEFEQVRASFGISEIFQRRILLNNLELVHGRAYGVGPDSGTFQFIDHLTEPISPEKNRPNRWQVKLQNLHVIDSSFIERLQNSELHGNGTSLSVQRDYDDNFILKPTLKELSLHSSSNSEEPSSAWVIGQGWGDLYIVDQGIIFRNATLKNGDSHLTIKAQTDSASNHKLSGSIEFQIDEKLFTLPQGLSFLLNGQGILDGTIANPQAHGTLSLAPETKAIFQAKDDLVFPLSSLAASYFFDYNDSNAFIEISELAAHGEGLTIESEHIHISDDEITGRIGLSKDVLSLPATSIYDITTELELGGSFSQPHTRLTGIVGGLTIQNYHTPALGFSIAHENNILDFSIIHQGQELGNASATGILSLSDETPRLTDVSFELNDLHLIPAQDLTSKETLLESLRLTGRGVLNGPLDPTKLIGTGNLMVSSGHFAGEAALKGDASLKDGTLNIDVKNDSQSLAVKIVADFLNGKEGQIDIALNDFKPEEYNPEFECILLDLKLHYAFHLDEIDHGNGQISLNRFLFGCDPYQVTLDQQYQLPIKRGTLTLPTIALQAPEGNLQISGNISSETGYQLDANGTINLSSFIGFLPGVDDLRGSFDTDISLSGPLEEPHLLGSAQLQNGEIAIESANISANNIKGSLYMSDDQIEVGDLTGTINGGNFTLGGVIFPNQLARSSLNLKLRSVLVEPNPDTIMDFSADLSLVRNNAGRAGIEGELRIESAEFRKNIDLLSLISAMTAQAFNSKRDDKEVLTMPEIDLNIDIQATRNLFVFTNWLGGELRGRLKMTGSLSNPVISGELETIAGWFGLRDRRFEITTGRLMFMPSSREPQIEVLGESNIFTRGGDSATVLVEILGPLSEPRVSLSSDVGIPQREILGLITTGGALSERTLVNVAAHDLELEEPSLVEELTALDWRRFLRGLARIDSLAVVPRYNAQTGLIEPSLLVEKRITQKISAIGESFVGRGVNQGKIGLLFKITPTINLIAAAETYAPRNETTLSIDLVKTILAAQIPFVEVAFSGNKTYKDAELLRGIHLTADSRVPHEEILRLQEELKSYYDNRGFSQAEVSAICLDDQTYCREIAFNIEEGPRSRIIEIAIEGDDLNDIINLAEIKELVGRAATTALIEKLKKDLLISLRKQGYFGARIGVGYQATDIISEVSLIITVFTGNKIDFVFNGNTHFTSEELLETINLDQRRQPFGANTINILIENIERKYRESGYLFATVSYQHQQDQLTGKTQYTISITEEQQADVSTVMFTGNQRLSEDQLLQLVNQYYPTIRDNIFFPEFAVAEQLERNTEAIRSLYIEEGFPNAQVDFKISPEQDGDSVVVEYLIHEGTQIISEWLEIAGVPEDVSKPPLPEGPYSIAKANSHTDALLDALKAAGYLRPAFSSRMTKQGKRLIIDVLPGSRTIISDIHYQGNLAISTETIRQHLEVKPGDPWVKEKLHASRLQLLRSGLFSRIEMEPLDEKLNDAKEVLLIRVTERPLQTLELGIGQNSSLGSHLFTEATDKSLFKDGRTIALRSDIYYQIDTNDITQGIASIRYGDPAFLDSNLRLSEDLRYQKIDTSTLPYDLDRFSLASYFFRPNENNWDWTAGHTILEEDLSRVKQDVILSDLDKDVVTLSFLSGTISYDNRDDPLVPAKGFLLSSDYKISSDFIASDANFFAIGGRASFLIPFSITSHHFMWAVNSQLATARPFDDTSDIPISQRYFLGGGSSIRGFAENSLGPKGTEGNPIGGDFLIANNLELRYAVMESLWAQTFVDAGNVYLQDENIKLSDIRTSAGVGIRFISPIGPIGVDIAKPIDIKAGEREVRVHFSIGANF